MKVESMAIRSVSLLLAVSLADALDDVPAEYRSLVRDYFKALNEEGGK